ncbi:MAG: hypothetical protein AAGD32_14520 [Planctomycetota bacterium]
MKYRTHILLIAAVAIAARLGLAVYWAAWDTPGAGEHGTIAANLLAGDGYSRGSFSYLSPTAARTPPYPLLLAGLIHLLGLPWAWMGALLINALAGAAVALLGVRVVEQIVGPDQATSHGLLAGWLLALWPTQIAAATYCQPGPLAAVALLAMLALPRTSWLWATVAAFIEPVLLPAVALGAIVRHRRQPALIALTFAALCAVLVPWSLRNTISVGVVEPITTTLWADAWAGNHDGATGSIGGDLRREAGPTRFDDLPPADRAMLNGKPEGDRTVLLRRWTFAWTADNPGGYAGLSALRLLKTLWLDWDDARARHPIVLVTRSAWLVLVLAGVVIARKRGVSVWPMLAVMGGAALIPTLTLAQMREVLVWEPVGLITFAAALTGGKR